MLGHARPDPGDLLGSGLKALDADGLRGGVSALSAPVIHPCRVESQKNNVSGNLKQNQSIEFWLHDVVLGTMGTSVDLKVRS
jgi:hypothetical protein